jgi:hypothetical protein
VAEPLFQANEVHTDHALRLPVLLVFDVNETLSNMAPLSARFEEVGASGQLAGTWFAGLLRDGFALAVGRENPPFASLAAEGLRMQLSPWTSDAAKRWEPDVDIETRSLISAAAGQPRRRSSHWWRTASRPRWWSRWLSRWSPW